VSWRRSDNIVFDYRLDDRGSIPLCVQTSFQAYPAFYPERTGGKEKPCRDADRSPPSSAEVKNELELGYTSSTPWRLHGGSCTDLLF
jgi:hypothetical protein